MAVYSSDNVVRIRKIKTNRIVSFAARGEIITNLFFTLDN